MSLKDMVDDGLNLKEELEKNGKRKHRYGNEQNPY